ERCALHSRSASASSSAFSVSSTLPRTTRSRWFLIRSSSIVMTLFSGLGVVSVMAAPFLAALVAFSHLPFSPIRSYQPYLNVRKMLFVRLLHAPSHDPVE